MGKSKCCLDKYHPGQDTVSRGKKRKKERRRIIIIKMVIPCIMNYIMILKVVQGGRSGKLSMGYGVRLSNVTSAKK
jgi:hypothetical protein